MMNNRYFFTPELMCNSSFTVGTTPVPESEMSIPARNTHNDHQSSGSSLSSTTSPFMIRMAMKISRSRWFSFVRRVFQYQNGLRTETGSNPFNSGRWMMIELVVLGIQISMISYTLSNCENEKPVWPMRIWVLGYGFGCVFSLLLLCWRYHVFVLSPPLSVNFPDIEQQTTHDQSRMMQKMNTYRSFLELLFGIWFVVGNIWMFDSRFFSFSRAPKLYMLCISLLSWNAISYSFPFILFLLLCCIVPIFSSFFGYNMNMGSVDRGALDEQISNLPSWSYTQITSNFDSQQDSSPFNDEDKPECCICLAKYKEKEEIRQLPCCHVFHLKCVDQWLRIISCCPLCKKDLQR